MNGFSGIEFDDVHVTFGHADGRPITALRSVNLRIPKGQFVCIVGKSGGGKSTLVRVLAGLMKPSAGTVQVGGASVTGPSERRAMVFQEDTVFPWLRVLDNVEFGLRAKSMPKAARSSLARSWLKSVGLGEAERSWPKELSGGMRKRVALATVFATGAEILLMDEPFGALDFVTRANLQSILLELWDQTGNTIVFVTHDIEEALVLGDRILVVSDGQILDDLMCDLPRPRLEDERSSARAVVITRTIVRHLGLVSVARASVEP